MGRPGRPPKESSARRTEVLRARATTQEFDALCREAQRRDMSLATLMRAALRQFLRESPDSRGHVNE
jgi:hypothetical protein